MKSSSQRPEETARPRAEGARSREADEGTPSARGSSRFGVVEVIVDGPACSLAEHAALVRPGVEVEGLAVIAVGAAMLLGLFIVFVFTPITTVLVSGMVLVYLAFARLRGN